MNKLAIFVEGYTELLFVDKLIRELAAHNAVLIQWRKIVGGTTRKRYNHQIKAEGPRAGSPVSSRFGRPSFGNRGKRNLAQAYQTTPERSSPVAYEGCAEKKA